MRINHAARICALSPSELEDFVDDWVAQRCKDYHAHELWRGTGDMGRDVTGYVTDRRLEGPWDNFQCKQLSSKLSEHSTFVELGKIFKNSADGAFSLPRAYTFVAPYGLVRNARDYIAHPEKFRQAFLDRWDTYIAKDLVENQVVNLTPEIEAKIRAFDFKRVDWLDAARLAKDPACKPALVAWFDADPGPWPRGAVPDEIQASESAYISQLLKVYDEKGPGTYPDAAAALACPEIGPHLRIQRTRFFDSVAFDRFYRDSTPDGTLKNFRDEIYHGVVDVHHGAHASRFTRLGQVMQQAAVLHPSGVLGKHAGPQVKQGTCHLLANEGLLPWDR
ncbi:ABC-three component system protein [Thauera butanivorans]|uniref:ABC-three component system protein n=1 Tax=Thauera butanivorans TaxID=86174 RepID=UPI003AB8DA9E